MMLKIRLKQDSVERTKLKAFLCNGISCRRMLKPLVKLHVRHLVMQRKIIKPPQADVVVPLSFCQ